MSQNQPNDVPLAKIRISLGIHHLIRLCCPHEKKTWVLGYPLSAYSHWADVKTDPSLHWTNKSELVLSCGGSNVAFVLFVLQLQPTNNFRSSTTGCYMAGITKLDVSLNKVWQRFANSTILLTKLIRFGGLSSKLGHSFTFFKAGLYPMQLPGILQMWWMVVAGDALEGNQNRTEVWQEKRPWCS